MLDTVLTQNNMTELSICPNTPVQPIQLQNVSLITQSGAQLDASTLENDNTADERDRSRRSTAPSPEPLPLPVGRMTKPSVSSGFALTSDNQHDITRS